MRAVVVGTTAYQSYSGLLGVKLRDANSITADLDIAQFASISVAVDDEVQMPFLDILRQVDKQFEPVAETFTRDKAAHYRIGTRYRVDILTPNRGRDSDELVLPALRADAQ